MKDLEFGNVSKIHSFTQDESNTNTGLELVLRYEVTDSGSLPWHHQRDETECDKNHLRWHRVLPEITEKKRCLSGCCDQPPGGVQDGVYLCSKTEQTSWKTSISFSHSYWSQHLSLWLLHPSARNAGIQNCWFIRVRKDFCANVFCLERNRLFFMTEHQGLVQYVPLMFFCNAEEEPGERPFVFRSNFKEIMFNRAERKHLVLLHLASNWSTWTPKEAVQMTL